VLTLEPASERGQALLMRGRGLWVFMPSVSQPVRLSLAQRLTGQVANGDLARANFSGDYQPVIVGSDTVEGTAAQILDLTAVDRSVTYAKVKYWVAQKDSRPIQAEFYALSGRLLKTCRYEDFRPLAGQTRPTRLVMEDALKKVTNRCSCTSRCNCANSPNGCSHESTCAAWTDGFKLGSHSFHAALVEAPRPGFDKLRAGRCSDCRLGKPSKCHGPPRARPPSGPALARSRP